MSIKIGEQTIGSRLQDAKVAAHKAAGDYYSCVRRLKEFDVSVRQLIENEPLRRRRERLIIERNRAWRTLQEANQLWDWMRAEATMHKTDNRGLG